MIPHKVNLIVDKSNIEQVINRHKYCVEDIPVKLLNFKLPFNKVADSASPMKKNLKKDEDKVVLKDNISKDYILNNLVKTYYWFNPAPLFEPLDNQLNEVVNWLKGFNKFRFPNSYDYDKYYQVILKGETSIIKLTEAVWIQALCLSPDQVEFLNQI
jgi:hypothetical protein